VTLAGRGRALASGPVSARVQDLGQHAFAGTRGGKRFDRTAYGCLPLFKGPCPRLPECRPYGQLRKRARITKNSPDVCMSAGLMYRVR
jgi:hypothetical protein